MFSRFKIIFAVLYCLCNHSARHRQSEQSNFLGEFYFRLTDDELASLISHLLEIKDTTDSRGLLHTFIFPQY